MDPKYAKFTVGQIIRHKKFGYRGVVVDVDPDFQGTDEWYQQVAKTNPPKDLPWYHILVHDANHYTYVAERNLEIDNSGDPINHPDLKDFFNDYSGGGNYTSTRAPN